MSNITCLPSELLIHILEEIEPQDSLLYDRNGINKPHRDFWNLRQVSPLFCDCIEHVFKKYVKPLTLEYLLDQENKIGDSGRVVIFYKFSHFDDNERWVCFELDYLALSTRTSPWLSTLPHEWLLSHHCEVRDRLKTEGPTRVSVYGDVVLYRRFPRYGMSPDLRQISFDWKRLLVEVFTYEGECL